MIKYIWIVMLVIMFIYWAIYTISDTIWVFKVYNPGYRFVNLEEASQGFYITIPTAIFFYSLFSFLV